MYAIKRNKWRYSLHTVYPGFPRGLSQKSGFEDIDLDFGEALQVHHGGPDQVGRRQSPRCDESGRTMLLSHQRFDDKSSDVAVKLSEGASKISGRIPFSGSSYCL